MSDLLKQFIQTPAPFYGLNGDDLAIGDGGDYRKKIPDEDFDKAHDPLVHIEEELLKRPMYFNLQMTGEDCMHLRVPALKHCMEFDKALRDLVGWRVRVCDAYRPMEVQRQGFCWGVKELLARSGDSTYERFLTLLEEAVTCGVPDEDIRFLEDYTQLGEQFFSYVEARPIKPKDFPKNLTPLVVHAAANFQLEGFELNPLAINEHNSGGIADIEFVDEKTGRLVPMGVAVDTPGVFSIFTCFEDQLSPIVKQIPRFPKELLNLKKRKELYRSELLSNVYLRHHLEDCGLDPKRLQKNDDAFEVFWQEVRKNRRIFSHLAFYMGIVVEGLEAWHVRFNDERDGVRHRRTGKVSGSGSYATHLGEKHCAWGSANPIYHKD